MIRMHGEQWQQVSSRTQDPLAPPKFWETDGVEASKKQVKPYSVEGTALAQYFRKGMPEDAQLANIYRVETAQPWQHYKLHRNEIYKRLAGQESSMDGLEMYLWHGFNKLWWSPSKVTPSSAEAITAEASVIYLASGQPPWVAKEDLSHAYEQCPRQGIYGWGENQNVCAVLA